MKKIVMFILMIFILQGCHTKQQLPDSTITNISQSKASAIISINNDILSKSVPEYSDIHDIGIPPKTGQSVILRITQEEFLAITEEELVDYLSNKKECTHHDWHAIVIDNDNAILCSYNQNEFIYGKWNENLGITEKLIASEDPGEFYSSIVQLKLHSGIQAADCGSV